MTSVALGLAAVAAVWFAFAAAAWLGRDRHRHDFTLWERELDEVDA